MSVDCISWAFKLKLPPMEKFVLVTISDHASKKSGRDIAWPSYRTLIERTGYTESTIKRAMRHLECWGLLTREKRGGDSGERSRSNLYVLHIDRIAPEGLIEEGATVTPSDNDDSEDETESTTYESKKGGGGHSDPPVGKEGGDSCDTREGTRGVPSNKNRNLEPSRIPLPQTNATAAHEAQSRSENKTENLQDSFRKLVNEYQQMGLISFKGDETKAWQTWKKLSLEDRQKASACLKLYLNGKKHEWRNWKDSARSDRHRGAPKPATLADYLRTRIFETVGTPVASAHDTPETDHAKFCRKIEHRGDPDPKRDYEWAFWFSVESDQWKAWDEFFRANGFPHAPQRKANFSEVEVMPKLGYHGARDYRELGWRFPQEWPPAFSFNEIEIGERATA